MKKILALLTFIVGLFALMTIASCDNSHRTKDSKIVLDSATVASVAEEVCNPEFTNVSAFVDYVRDESRYIEFISIAKSLDPHTVAFIASEVLNQNRRLNWDSWLDEYNTNRQKYLSLDRTNRLNLNDRFIEYEHLEVSGKEDTVCVQ